METTWSYDWSRHRGVINEADSNIPVLVQEAPAQGRPYIHPLHAPKGSGILTENAPGHHPWQHGLYVGLNDVNGIGFWTEGLGGDREKDGLFACSELSDPAQSGGRIQWEVQCQWSAPDGVPLLLEQQKWSMVRREGAYELDLCWTLTADMDIRFGKYDYGGLFLRMPYRNERGGEVSTSEGLAFPEAEGERARWVAVWMPIEGEENGGGIAILDHDQNPEHPVPWRVDGQLGISPSRCIVGAWNLPEGASSTNKYRIVAFSDKINTADLSRRWEQLRGCD
ncbi:MAG: PmoA family protein [Candidatus Latescibacterota bacterium]